MENRPDSLLLAVAVALCVTVSATPTEAQFGNLAEKLKKAQEAVKEGKKKGDDGLPKEKPSLPRDPATSERPATPPVGASPGATTPTGSALWPNIATDESIVAMQQRRVRADCEKEKASRGAGMPVDCACMADRYPALRLRKLSDDIWAAKRKKDLGCTPPSPGESAARQQQLQEYCAAVSEEFESITSRERQIYYPASMTSTPGKATSRRFSIEEAKANADLHQNIYYDSFGQCKDGSESSRHFDN